MCILKIAAMPVVWLEAERVEESCWANQSLPVLLQLDASVTIAALSEGRPKATGTRPTSLYSFLEMHFIVFLDLISLTPSAIQSACARVFGFVSPLGIHYRRSKSRWLWPLPLLTVCFKEDTNVFLVVLYSDQFILPFSLTCSRNL